MPNTPPKPQPKTRQAEANEPINNERPVIQEAQKLSLSQLIASALAAGLGVQSSKNRERDFKQGRAPVFIVTGVVFTLIFIGSVFSVVTLVLNNR
ncbi:MAG: DUF2970 domain-containing protein [Pseudomonadota bacterium]